MKRIAWFSVPAALLLAGLGACVMERQAEADSGMSFFITSVGTGQGADLGGLEGADHHCQQLAQSAGAGIGHGAPISAPRRLAVSRRSMHATASGEGHGRTPRPRSSPGM